MCPAYFGVSSPAVPCRKGWWLFLSGTPENLVKSKVLGHLLCELRYFGSAHISSHLRCSKKAGLETSPGALPRLLWCNV